jgi:hypothetical protein
MLVGWIEHSPESPLGRQDGRGPARRECQGLRVLFTLLSTDSYFPMTTSQR